MIGAGPAGLMAAEALASQGLRVWVFDAKPSVGRKFLMAGRGGLNITHSEPFDNFVARYRGRSGVMQTVLAAFDAQALRDWVHGLGVQTFVGSSGRVFPQEMKAAPLLRAWLHRLRGQDVQFFMRHRWLGWHAAAQVASSAQQACETAAPSPYAQNASSHTPLTLSFESPEGQTKLNVDAVIFALGGGSWAKLGSDGAWWPWLKALGISLAPLAPSNGGFEAKWSAHFTQQYAGTPLKTASFKSSASGATPLRGECLVTQHGLEGGAIYTLSADLRDQIANRGRATLTIDLLPDHTPQRVVEELTRARGAKSMSSHLRTRLGLHGVKAGLLRECVAADIFKDPVKLAQAIKALPVVLTACRPLDEAISTAGGVKFEELTAGLMLEKYPGIFIAGEMLDWEAPTGGYLLNACLATGLVAGNGVAQWLQQKSQTI